MISAMPRAATNADKVYAFMRFMGRRCRGPGRVYIAGGASAAVIGWRDTTMDIDCKLDPEPAGAFAAIAEAKEALDMNVEMAAPDNFIPALPGWRDRSVFIAQHGPVEFLHYDFYAQALAKIARRHERDEGDVAEMHRRGLINPHRLERLFAVIEPEMGEYPGLDSERFRDRVQEWLVERAGFEPAKAEI